MPELPAQALSLHRVTALPLDLSAPVYSHYTLLKLGVEESVSFYAARLAPLVERCMAATPSGADWVLTAPAYDVIPAAANLLCQSLHALLAARLPAHTRPAIIEIRQAKVEAANADRRELGRANDYSRLGWRDRRESRVYWNRLMVEHEGFAGRPVVFVNDINVTGAQREGMQRYFERVGAASVVWLCIIDVDAAIGRREPQLEYAINNTRQLSAAALGEVLAGAGIRFTSKCVARIFAFEAPELASLLAVIGAERSTEILRLAVAEGRYGDPEFREKLDLLRAACARGWRR